MGSVRSLYIKRAAREFIEKYHDRFSTDFRHNSEALNQILKIESKPMRNRIAGYISTLMKQEKEV